MLVWEWVTSRMVLAPIARSAPMSWKTCSVARSFRSCAIQADSPSELDDCLDALAHAASASLEKLAAPKVFEPASRAPRR
ncbi:hypothetical protein ASD51_09030 [Streptomyces sp. Root55]|nr:hypothetical protein ASD26_15965 [Streptomyces sp. Root1319]KQZ10381.1 hypothetical protein ASD51_09030 [Streptomyces sp. Root55]